MYVWECHYINKILKTTTKSTKSHLHYTQFDLSIVYCWGVTSCSKQLPGELYLRLLTCQVSVKDFNLYRWAASGKSSLINRGEKCTTCSSALIQWLLAALCVLKCSPTVFKHESEGKRSWIVSSTQRGRTSGSPGARPSSTGRRRLSPRVWRPQTRPPPQRRPLPASSLASAAWKPPFLLSHAADSSVLPSLPSKWLVIEIYLLVNLGYKYINALESYVVIPQPSPLFWRHR